jgi:hypothetical protein
VTQGTNGPDVGVPREDPCHTAYALLHHLVSVSKHLVVGVRDALVVRRNIVGPLGVVLLDVLVTVATQ